MIQNGLYPPFNKSKLSVPSALCNEPLSEQVEFYDSKVDLSLSGFLLTAANTLFNRCKSCKQPKYCHVDLYYQGTKCIRIVTEPIGVKHQIKEDRSRKRSQKQNDLEEISKFVSKEKMLHQKENYATSSNRKYRKRVSQDLQINITPTQIQ